MPTSKKDASLASKQLKSKSSAEATKVASREVVFDSSLVRGVVM
jgi:hypothetical protein